MALRSSLSLLAADSYKEAQRPIAAALRVKNTALKAKLLRQVAHICTMSQTQRYKIAKGNNNNKDSISFGRRLSNHESSAKMVCMLSYCRSQGDWEAAYLLAKYAKETYHLQLKQEWFQICIGAARATEKETALKVFSELFEGIPSNYFSRSVPLSALSGGKGDVSGELGVSSSATPLKGIWGANSMEGGEGDGAVKNHLDMTKSLALLSSRGGLVSDSSALTTVHLGELNHFGRAESLASFTVNPSFNHYLQAQGIACSNKEVGAIISALSGSRDGYGIRKTTRRRASPFNNKPIPSSLSSIAPQKDNSISFDDADELDIVRHSFLHREVTVRINKSFPEWRAVRELLRRQQPILVPLQWYPDGLAWRLAYNAHNGGNMEVVLRSAAGHVRHLLQILADERLVSFQSIPSMLPAYLLKSSVFGRSCSNERGETRILDVCAAPGGKAGQLIDFANEEMLSNNINKSYEAARRGTSRGTVESQSTTKNNNIIIVVNDADRVRLDDLRGRLGNASPGVCFTNFPAEVFPIHMSTSNLYNTNGDGNEGTDNIEISSTLLRSHNNNPPTANNNSINNSVFTHFDGVLLDVPCSGEGRLRRDNQAWRRWHPRECLKYHKLQLKALRRAIYNTNIGGCIVYSTCTMNPLENEAVVAAVVAEGLVDITPLHPITSASHISQRDVHEDFGETGRIPVDFEPFLSKGLSHWGIPLHNGEYFYLNSSGSKGDYNNTAQQDHWANNSENTTDGTIQSMQRLLKSDTEVTKTMFPPLSKALQDMIRSRCVRILPHLLGSDVGSDTGNNTSNVGGSSVSSMEAFFVARLTVKRHPNMKDNNNKNKNNINDNNINTSQAFIDGGIRHHNAQGEYNSNYKSGVQTFDNARDYRVIPSPLRPFAEFAISNKYDDVQGITTEYNAADTDAVCERSVVYSILMAAHRFTTSSYHKPQEVCVLPCLGSLPSMWSSLIDTDSSLMFMWIENNRRRHQQMGAGQGSSSRKQLSVILATKAVAEYLFSSMDTATSEVGASQDMVNSEYFIANKTKKGSKGPPVLMNFGQKLWRIMIPDVVKTTKKVTRDYNRIPPVMLLTDEGAAFMVAAAKGDGDALLSSSTNCSPYMINIPLSMLEHLIQCSKQPNHYIPSSLSREEQEFISTAGNTLQKSRRPLVVNSNSFTDPKWMMLNHAKWKIEEEKADISESQQEVRQLGKYPGRKQSAEHRDWLHKVLPVTSNNTPSGHLSSHNRQSSLPELASGPAVLIAKIPSIIPGASDMLRIRDGATDKELHISVYLDYVTKVSTSDAQIPSLGKDNVTVREVRIFLASSEAAIGRYEALLRRLKGTSLLGGAVGRVPLTTAALEHNRHHLGTTHSALEKTSYEALLASNAPRAYISGERDRMTGGRGMKVPEGDIGQDLVTPTGKPSDIEEIQQLFGQQRVAGASPLLQSHELVRDGCMFSQEEELQRMWLAVGGERLLPGRKAEADEDRIPEDSEESDDIVII